MDLLIKCLFVLISLGNLSFTQSQDLFPVSIIHINDFHARFDEINSNRVTCNREKDDVCYGGYARVITVVKSLMESRKAENKNPIYLNAADNFQGTLWYNIYRGNATSYFLNLYPADAITLGNHEFDHKIEGLIPFMEAINSPIVVCNIDDSEEPTFQGLYKKSIIIDRYSRKIGVIGVILQTTYDLADTGKLKFLDEAESLKKEAAILKAQGVDIIIALSHCGVDVDIDIAENVGSDVDVIVGGHTHSFLYTGDDYPSEKPVGDYPTIITQPSGHTVLVVQAAAYTRYMGDLTVYFDEAGEIKEWEGKPIFLDETIQQDPSIMEELAPWRVEVDLIGLEEIGLSKVDLSNAGCNVGETNIGSFIADSYVYAYMDQEPEEGSWAPATISFTNCGGIRSSIGKGSINYGDLVGVTPFDNSLDIMQLTGKTIKEALEHAANEATPDNFYSYNQLQVSGMKIVYNVTNPIGEKVVSVKILCNKCVVPKYLPLDEEEVYSAIVPSFIAGGKDGFTMLLDHKGHQVGRLLDIEGFHKYLSSTAPVYQSKSGRITLVK